MGLFRKDEENFDASAAFESDQGGIIKIVLAVIVLIVILIIAGFIVYNQYPNWIGNKTTNETMNETPGGNWTAEFGTVVINFTDFNLTVRENPGGVYYYTTQDKVVDEKCYIDGRRKSCKSLTNKVCAKDECRKELVTEKECFVNSEKIDCPE